MNELKISIITVVYNAKDTIKDCITSVLSQNYANIEYIIIDGGSTDGTLEVIAQFKDIALVISEPDRGIYDAMNKGIALATGDVIGTLNADDYLVATDIISDIAAAFSDTNAQIIYGNLDFINREGEIFRKWRAGRYKWGVYNWGWMAPHPTFYCRKDLFDKLGVYSLDFGTAADYELMLRFMHMNKLDVYYLDKVMVKMRVGGVSNKSVTNRLKASYNDLKAMKKNKVLLPILAIFLKPLRKVEQFFEL